MPHPDTLCREEVEIPDDIRKTAQQIALDFIVEKSGAMGGGADLIARALLAERQAQRERDAWRPIETAPKDTTEVIVLCGRKDVRLGWYFAPSSRTFGWRDQNSRKIKPTQMMPLPSHPDSIRDGGDHA